MGEQKGIVRKSRLYSFNAAHVWPSSEFNWWRAYFAVTTVGDVTRWNPQTGHWRHLTVRFLLNPKSPIVLVSAFIIFTRNTLCLWQWTDSVLVSWGYSVLNTDVWVLYCLHYSMMSCFSPFIIAHLPIYTHKESCVYLSPLLPFFSHF